MSNTKPFTPDDAYAQIADLDRRLKNLETAPRLPNTALDITTSAFSINTPGQNFPLVQYDSEGLALPSMPIPISPVLVAGAAHTIGACAVTAALDTIIYSGSLFASLANAISISIPWLTDAATTGALAISNNVVGGHATSVVTLPAGSSGVQVFNWLHGGALGVGPFVPSIVARRLTGVGNVNIFAPSDLKMLGGSHIGATVTGL